MTSYQQLIDFIDAYTPSEDLKTLRLKKPRYRQIHAAVIVMCIQLFGINLSHQTTIAEFRNDRTKIRRSCTQ